MFIRQLKILLLLYCCSSGISGYAQTPVGAVKPDAKLTPGVTAESGGFSSLYNLSLYDGSATVSIPIYPFEAAGASYGISLVYNCRGIKVDTWSGVCGLGWALALGSITRTVRDLPDEISVVADNDSVFIPNELGPGGVTAHNRFVKFKGKFAAYGETPQQAADTNTYRDEESDEYQVSIGKLSFSFRLGSNGSIFTHPQRNVSVQLTLDGVVTTSITNQLVGASPGSLVPGFIITDEEGNKYYFARGDYGLREITEDYYGRVPVSRYSQVSKWDVQKIVLASGTVINYTYLQQSYPPAFPTYHSYGLAEAGSAAYLGGPVHGDDNFSSLKSISYPNGVTADFIYDSGNNRRRDIGSYGLREIRVTSGGNCLRYRLDQSYFVAENRAGAGIKEVPYNSGFGYDPQSAPFYRLKLNGITLMSCDSSKTEPYYSFSYDTTSLPRRLFGGQDWFGYYNGNIPLQFSTSPTDSSLTVPLHKCYNANGPWVNKDIGVDKTENPAKARAGILTGIANAYGGTVSFGYSGHAALSNMLAGLPTSNVYYFGFNAGDGLLLTSVTEKDSYHPENTRTTTIDYTGGQYFLNGGYFHYPRQMEDMTNAVPFITMTGVYNSPHQFINGANHGYSNVTVTTRAGVAGTLLSRKEITFSNFSDPTSGNQPRRAPLNGGTDFFEFPYTDKTYIRDWEMGLAQSITEYDQNNRIVQQTKNFYHSTPLTYAPNAEVHKVLVNRKDMYPENGLGYYAKRKVADTYTPFTAKSLLDSTIVLKYYTDNNFIADTLRYQYDTRYNLKDISSRNSKGEELLTRQFYNYEMSFDLGGGAFVMPLSGLEKRVGTQRWKRIPGASGSLPENGTLIGADFNGIVMEGNLATNPRLRDKNRYDLITAKAMNYSQYTSTGTTSSKVQAVFGGQEVPAFQKSSEVVRVDLTGNPLEIQTKEQYKAMIWDTATGQKLAEAGNCRYSDIAYSSFETGSYNTNLDYNPAQLGILSNGGISGGKCFALWNTFNQTANYLNSTQNLQAGKEYILSFWVSGNNPTVTAGGAVQTLPASATYTKGNWKNYQVRFTPGAAGTKISFNGTAVGSFLDEVRLFPAVAQMQSWTYNPLFGIGSQTDAGGRITTYDYDNLGRQTLVRDQEGNIMTKTQFTVGGLE